MAVSHRTARPNVEEYRFADRPAGYLLGRGAPRQPRGGAGSPVEIMDLSFALQALSAEHLARHGREMAVRVHAVPAELDRGVALAALGPMGVAIDEPTPEQLKYAESWEEGS